jgi:5'-3' exonuclease
MLLLIDLSHIWWTSWHATAHEEASAAFELTVGAVHKLRSTLCSEGDHVALCLDTPPYKRKAIAPDYKAQRDAPEPAALDQFRRVRERLETDGFLSWGAVGYEADDIIATAVRLVGEQPDATQVIIATNDKDLLQLVRGDRTCLVYSTKTQTMVGAAEVQEKFGIAPEQMRDWLSLTGDTSDNVPGVRGIGPKRATALLTEFGSLQTILNIAVAEDPENKFTPPGVRTALLASVEDMRKARDLVTLMSDAPIKLEDLDAPREQKQLVTIADAEFEDIPSEISGPALEPKAEASKPEPKPEQKAEAKPEPRSKSEPKVPDLEFEPRKESKPAECTAIIVPRSEEWSLALEPRNLTQAWAISKVIYNSRLFACASQEAAMMILMTGRSLRLDCATAMRGIHIVKGRPTLSAALIEALVLVSGKCEYFQLIESTSERATYETKRIGAPLSVKMSWTKEDSELAGLMKPSERGEASNHVKRPKTMFRWRAVAELARTVYPDVIMGLYLPDELEEAE